MIFHQPHNSQRNYNHNVRTYENARWNPHFHKNLELITVEKGEIALSINGKTYTLCEGFSALILSNQIHAFSVPCGSIATVTVFSEDYVPVFASQMKELDSEYPIFCIDEVVAELFKKSVLENDSSVFMRKACFYAICDEFSRKVVLKTRSDTDKETVVRILDWIRHHSHEDISLKDVSSIFGYEYHYLSRLLNQNYSISFSDIINGYRVDRAIELLQSTTLSVTEVAIQSGFQSIRNFNLVFKAMTGKSPKEFRN